MHGEMPSYSGQGNDNCMHTVLEIEVHQGLNGCASIEWLGIANSPYSVSKLHFLKLSFLKVSFQDSITSNRHS
jgi:hypothetical protein